MSDINPSKKEILEYIEKFAFFIEKRGMTRTQGRILGYLTVSEEEQSTLDQISEFINLSKSTISPELKILVDIGLVERLKQKDIIKGGRGYVFKVEEEIWMRAMDDKGEASRIFISIADMGIDLLKNTSSKRQRRLKEMKMLFAFLQREMPKLMDRYREYRDENIQFL